MQMQPMPGFGMGMMSMSYSTSLNMMPVPAPVYPLSSATAGMHLIPGLGVLPVPQMQVPLIASQAPPANTATSTVPPQFNAEVNCTSQNVPRIATEPQQLPILRQGNGRNSRQRPYEFPFSQPVK
nr:hypothetical protein CFP56_12418 [Quercus suber]